jgi:hypothetical protein
MLRAEKKQKKKPRICEGPGCTALNYLIYQNRCSKNMFQNRQAIIGNTLFLSNTDILLSLVYAFSFTNHSFYIIEFSDNIPDFASL